MTGSAETYPQIWISRLDRSIEEEEALEKNKKRRKKRKGLKVEAMALFPSSLSLNLELEHDWYRYIDTKHKSPPIILISTTCELTVQMLLQQDRFNRQGSPIARKHGPVLAQTTREACKYDLWEHDESGWTAGIPCLVKNHYVTMGTVRSFKSRAAITQAMRVEQARLQSRRDGERVARNTTVSDPIVLPSQKALETVTKEQPLLIKALDPE